MSTRYEGLDLSIALSRAKFESLNERFFLKCIETVKAVMKDGKITPAEVRDIVLVGTHSSATHCNTLQRTATHCHILQHTATQNHPCRSS